VTAVREISICWLLVAVLVHIQTHALLSGIVHYSITTVAIASEVDHSAEYMEAS
jgi:hypothetical protein